MSAMDISSDLTELGRTPVAVISAGVKSILDIPRTLEYLVYTFVFCKYNWKLFTFDHESHTYFIMQETQGVCVATYKTNEFPAFFTEKSGCKVCQICFLSKICLSCS